MEKPALKLKNVNDRKELDPKCQRQQHARQGEKKIPTRGNTSLTAKLRKQSLYIHYKEGIGYMLYKVCTPWIAIY